jgi:glycosyltransferase involved in cell wall biosynthesis
MNLLHITSYPPHPLRFGGAIRSYHLLKSLAAAHRVDVICFGAQETLPGVRKVLGPGVGEIRIVPEPLFSHMRRLGQAYSLLSRRSFFSLCKSSRKMSREVEEALHRKSFDAVQSEFYTMGAYVPECGTLRVVDAHNVEYDNMRRIEFLTAPVLRRHYYRLDAGKMREEELAVYRGHDHVICTSERDKAILDLDVPQVGKSVIPNGVDLEYFSHSGAVQEPHSLVFTGSMGYVPNYDGMHFFLDEIFPLVLQRIPDARIYIVGSGPPASLLAKASPNVIVTGAVDDVRPFVRRAAVFVVPLRMGGGTRLKVLEALAMGRPVVTTTIGCEGIEVEQGETALIEDHAPAFAERIVQLLRDGTAQYRLISRGHELVRERYDWSVIGRVLGGIYDNLLAKRRTSVPGPGTAPRHPGASPSKVMHERSSLEAR